MDVWFQAIIWDAAKGVIESSKGNPVRMTEEQISQYTEMKARHDAEEQEFCRRIFVERQR